MPNMPSLFEIDGYEMIVLQVLFLAGVIGAITAKAKGRSGLVWFVLSAITYGFAILVLLFVPSRTKKRRKNNDGTAYYEDGDYDSDSGSDSDD
ncbi:hypothetical protein [uncultured Cohaesibacter sp.]|uniref:hypothetical protein n=1 Tax=uncultured Cohaesibacter sp. TaxID=1002546 RepID=UPI002931A114|nr:hypothetical protein [uncultured Cohaesibacter sp.]